MASLDVDQGQAASDAAAICRRIEDRTDELGMATRVPSDLYEDLLLGGFFRPLVHPDLGGTGGTAGDWFSNGVALAHADASVGWVVTQGAAEMAWIGAGGDLDWAGEVTADPLGASASTIAGRGILVVDGDRGTLSGRWGFNTGCHGATWIGGLTALDHGDGPSDEDWRFCWVPADRAEILDDWDPSGLRGTGSNSTVIPEQEIPLAWTVDIWEAADADRGPYGVAVGNGNWPIGCSVGIVQLGASRRALDETLALLESKEELPGPKPLTHNPGIGVAYFEADAQWHAAHASLERELARMWEEAEHHRRLSPEQRIRVRMANTNANRTAVDIGNLAMRLTNTTTANPRHRLSRSVRDIFALQGHIGTNRRMTELAAEYHLGVVDEPFGSV